MSTSDDIYCSSNSKVNLSLPERLSNCERFPELLLANLLYDNFSIAFTQNHSNFRLDVLRSIVELDGGSPLIARALWMPQRSPRASHPGTLNQLVHTPYRPPDKGQLECIQPGSKRVKLGAPLHFQLPPTIGMRGAILKQESALMCGKCLLSHGQADVPPTVHSAS